MRYQVWHSREFWSCHFYLGLAGIYRFGRGFIWFVGCDTWQGGDGGGLVWAVGEISPLLVVRWSHMMTHILSTQCLKCFGCDWY